MDPNRDSAVYARRARLSPTARLAGRAAAGVDQQLAARAEHLLAVHVGPVARILVKKAAQSARGTRDFIAALAETTEDDADRAAFLAAAAKKL